MHNELFKKANAECEYTHHQIQELVKCSNDPIYFIKHYIKIQSAGKGAMLFDMYDYQEEMVLEFQDNKFVVIKIARQSGKTTIIAAYILWYTCFRDDELVLVASNKNSNAMEIMQRIIYGYEELPFWIKPGVKYGTKHSLEFDNGSRIISQATTENTGRGLSVTLLMLDELAFVSKRVQNEMWTSLAPTLSTGGSCIIASTPNGDDDLFATLWTGAELGQNGFVPVTMNWDCHPDRGEEFKHMMIGKIGASRWAQEYLCLRNDQLITIRDNDRVFEVELKDFYDNYM